MNLIRHICPHVDKNNFKNRVDLDPSGLYKHFTETNQGT